MNFKIDIFATIDGIGAASGIVHLDNNLFIIGDNSNFLYQYSIATKKLKKHGLAENSQANIAKKQKPDFEAITLKNKKLHIFGSGSTKNRNLKIIFDLGKQTTKNKDCTKLYQKFKNTAQLTDDDLNIEGAMYHNNNLYLINRGNGATTKNGIFIKNKITKTISYHSYHLPIINGVVTSFTDAIIANNKIYFLACAEDSSSTYLDGTVYGSILGIIDPETLEVIWTIQISDNQKFEGLTIYSHSENEINFLLCEDNDTEQLQSNLYQLTIYNHDKHSI